MTDNNNDRSWELLVKLIEACGVSISEIEDEFDFDEMCDTMKGRMQEYEELRNALKEEEIHKRTYLKSLLDCKEECEKLKEQLQANQPTGICETCMAEAILQNDKYRKELEELKETNELLKSQMAFNLNEMETRLGNEINRSETLLKELKRFDKIKDEFREMSEQLKTKNDRYRKALDEIEEVINNILNSCLGRNTVGCRPAHNVCGDLIKILNIINKTKEGI